MSVQGYSHVYSEGPCLLEGVLSRDMGKEAPALECTNSLGSEEHIHIVPSLAASRSPVPPAALPGAGATRAGLPRGGKQRSGGCGVHR